MALRQGISGKATHPCRSHTGRRMPWCCRQQMGRWVRQKAQTRASASAGCMAAAEMQVAGAARNARVLPVDFALWNIIEASCIGSSGTRCRASSCKQPAATEPENRHQPGDPQRLPNCRTFMRVLQSTPCQPAGQRHQPVDASHTPAGAGAAWKNQRVECVPSGFTAQYGSSCMECHPAWSATAGTM